ncbi:MAG: LysR family transcriptional regulator, partial [Variovorax sp.]
IERGALVPVLKDYMPRDLWLYAAYSQRRHNSAALRVLLDFLEARIRSPPPAPPAGQARAVKAARRSRQAAAA